jgi:hypothetical protein
MNQLQALDIGFTWFRSTAIDSLASKAADGIRIF